MKGRRDLAASAAYEPEPAAAAAARRFVRETLCSWRLADRSSRLVDDAVLLTSELVTNAIVHAGTPLQVSCRLDGGELEVAVRDRHPARTLGEANGAADDPESTNGRGLLLPAALASSWGVSYARTGKAVWFRMAVTDHSMAGQDRPQGPADEALGRTAPQGALGTADDIRLVPVVDDPLAAIGRLSYDELLRHTVETARDAAGADAAYVLVADEDGELRIRAGAGLGNPELLASLARSAVGIAQVPHDGDGPRQLPAVYDDLARLVGGVSAVTDSAARSLVTVPFLAEGRVTGVLAAAAAEPDRFTHAHADRLQQVADRVALSLERARLAELERVRRGRISFLAEASDLLAGTLDEDKTIALAAQLMVPRLATWCAVYLVGGKPGAAARPGYRGTADWAGSVSRPAYVWHSDEAHTDALRALLDHLPPPQIPSRPVASRWSMSGLTTSALLPAGAADFASDAVWCCPLVARGRVLGAFVIGRPCGDWFTRESVETVEDLSRRAALALDNARLYSQQMQTSQALQRSLLPPDVPRIPGLDLAVAYAAVGEGNEVGGDFYDVFAVAHDRWRFAIGDVCGTGPEAAAVTGLARYTMRILSREGHGVAAVLERLNRLILDEGPRARFITLVHGEIITAWQGGARDGPHPNGARTDASHADRRRSEVARTDGPRLDDYRPGGAMPGGPPRATPSTFGGQTRRAASTRVSLVCAGHPPPLLLRAGGRPEPAAMPQPLLGVLNDISFRSKAIDLWPGDVLLCVTDGVTERRRAGRLLDDGDGLIEVFAECAGLNAGAVAARIMRVVQDFAPQPPADDTALIVMRAL